MRPAVIGPVLADPFDVGVVVAPVGVCREKCIHRGLRYLTVVIVRVLQQDHHVLVGDVVADAIDEAAFRDALAGERFEIDRAAIFHVHGLGLGASREAEESENCY